MALDQEWVQDSAPAPPSAVEAEMLAVEAEMLAVEAEMLAEGAGMLAVEEPRSAR